MTEKIEINRQTVYLTIDNVKSESNSGIEKGENEFVGYYKNEPTSTFNKGKQIKNENGENIIFNSIEQAKEEVIEILKKRIYPPSFLNPMEYTAKNIAEIMHKELTFDIGDFHSGKIKESISGVITRCTLANNSPGLPFFVRITTNTGERTFRIDKLLSIRR